MRTSAAKIVLPLLTIAVGLSAVFYLTEYLQRNRPLLPENYVDSDLSLQGRRLKGFVFGAEGLVADWYWISALQYIGDKVVNSPNKAIDVSDLRPLNPRLLYPYLDNATDLDPRFITAYSYGSIVLPAIDSEQAIKLTEKGIANNPNEWRFYQYLGYINWKLGRYDAASQAYLKGSEINGSPQFMRLMAGSMKNEGGSRDTARAIFQQMLDESNDSQTTYYANGKLMNLDSLDEQEAIRPVLQKFKENTGRCVNGWAELLPMLRAVKLPHNKGFRVDPSGNIVDPSGAPYFLNKETCDVALNVAVTKVPLK